ncbi:unnamed protein product [Rotaria sp. Silwood2]|nr:unnamed protein product [Rotaria sp. Silwood2]CAF2972295.1 unnamed protein product [Rotaria sp. Silwood2]CAF4023306.1 unnamed protein product [Rotaria sp. Silwood2]CAF4378840.1 unnamed protein product [Rotaria sp. Silwood2]
MNLESLANELLLDLFEYFSSVYLLQTFYDLNTRLNNLILHHFQSHILNFQSVSKYDFDIVCQKYLPSISDRIISLRLSDDDDTPKQIDLFFSYGLSFNLFSHLKSLSIYHVYSLNSLKRITNELLYLPQLTHLKITRHTIVYNEIYDIGIIDPIGRFPKLAYCYLDIINDNDCYFLTPSMISSSLKYLSVPYLDCNINQLIYLIKYIPYLQSLNIRIVDHATISQIPTIIFLSIKKLKVLFFGTLNAMKNLLQTMSNLENLKIEMESTYIDGYQWKTMIENYLPNLILFQFKMSTSLSHQQNKEEKIDEILNSFRSQFWIEKHQWFVQCYWISADTSSVVYVYTLPYAFADFFYIGDVRLKSTCPNDNQYWSFDAIHNLYYGYVSYQNLFLSHIHLDNIHYLDLTIPFDESFWSMVTTLERLNSLNIVSYGNMDPIDIHSKLQILFDRSPHLHSLKFFSWFAQDEFPFDIKHPSIRQLDLQGPNIVYNQQHCLKLSHSFIGQQCEVLFVTVKQRTDIIDLVNNMKNLRALIVQCTKPVLMQKENENLIEWLQQHLPMTCSISNSIEVSNSIRLWIR